MYLVYRYMYCLYNQLLYTQPKCFGNTVERYGHANKASFEFQFEFERERERGREREREGGRRERERECIGPHIVETVMIEDVVFRQRGWVWRERGGEEERRRRGGRWRKVR